MELVTFITGSFFLYIGIKMLLTKIFIDIGLFVFTNKYVVLGLVLLILSYTLLPLTQPFIDSLIDLIVGSVVSIFNYLWEVLETIIEDIIGQYL